MADKELFKQVISNYKKDKIDGNETFGPLISPDFDYQKHYGPLMQSYKNALWRIAELEELLSVAACPQNCIGGAVPDDKTCYQCQFCDERAKLLPAQPGE